MSKPTITAGQLLVLDAAFENMISTKKFEIPEVALRFELGSLPKNKKNELITSCVSHGLLEIINDISTNSNKFKFTLEGICEVTDPFPVTLLQSLLNSIKNAFKLSRGHAFNFIYWGDINPNEDLKSSDVNVVLFIYKIAKLVSNASHSSHRSDYYFQLSLSIEEIEDLVEHYSTVETFREFRRKQNQPAPEPEPQTTEKPSETTPSASNEPKLERSSTTEGLEQEVETEITPKPFDPTKVDVELRSGVMDLLVKRLRADEIDLAPAFQRKEVWKPRDKSRLIESILIRIPLPAFYLDGTKEDKWIVIDGLQRLSTIRDFAVLETMELNNLEFLTQYNGKKFADLPRDLRRRFEETQVTLYIVRPGTPPEVKFNIFKRINTGGMPLSPQEIRQALNQGPIAVLLETLSKHPDFIKATAGSIKGNRMEDRELVLRFFVFFSLPHPPVVTKEIDFFLSESMGSLNKVSDEERKTMSESFIRSMRLATKIFGEDAFRKRYLPTHGRYPINKSLFEGWSVALARMNEEQGNMLAERKQLVLEKFMLLMNNKEFEQAVSQGTTEPKKMKLRFEKIQALLAEVLAT
jgi:hypothetical protein